MTTTPLYKHARECERTAAMAASVAKLAADDAARDVKNAQCTLETLISA